MCVNVQTKASRRRRLCDYKKLFDQGGRSDVRAGV